MTEIKTIAFDADDTLWVNEPYFRKAEDAFCALMENYLPHHSSHKELFAIEIKNLPLYGYGIKAFTLSMIEAAMSISNKTITLDAIEQMMQIGREMLEAPVELIPDIESVLQALQGKYRLVMATKGDLLDQERKLEKSGLSKYFHHIEVMSEKKIPNYEKLIRHLDIPPNEFLMIGNSLKSDVLPVLELGGHAFHVPFHTTWAYERVETTIENERFRALGKVTEVVALLGGLVA
ncbi:MAG: HAD family hydrolase [Bacteroidota bacterium]